MDAAGTVKTIFRNTTRARAMRGCASASKSTVSRPACRRTPRCPQAAVEVSSSPRSGEGLNHAGQLEPQRRKPRPGVVDPPLLLYLRQLGRKQKADE